MDNTERIDNDKLQGALTNLIDLINVASYLIEQDEGMSPMHVYNQTKKIRDLLNDAAQCEESEPEEVGKGYRLLEDGEVIQEGDEWYDGVREIWRSTDYSISSKVLKVGLTPYRRKVEEEEPTYRLLKEGEVIQEGDEFYELNEREWLPVTSVGWKVVNTSYPVRRKV